MARRTRRVETWGWFEHPLTAAQTAEKGEMACLDIASGLLAVGVAGNATLRPIGHFDDGDGTTTGDGTTKVRVVLFDEIRLHWFDNDGGTPVVAADVGGLCYIVGAQAVTGAGAGNSVAGRVWAVDTAKGVLVEMRGFDDAGA